MLWCNPGEAWECAHDNSVYLQCPTGMCSQLSPLCHPTQRWPFTASFPCHTSSTTLLSAGMTLQGVGLRVLWEQKNHSNEGFVYLVRYKDFLWASFLFCYNIGEPTSGFREELFKRAIRVMVVVMMANICEVLVQGLPDTNNFQYLAHFIHFIYKWGK